MADIALNKRQKDFCIYYVETGNAYQSYVRAGYKEGTKESVYVNAHKLLKNPKVRQEIDRLMKPQMKEQEKHIATAQEVMQFFTQMMNGEIKDQFGIDASNADRIKAAQEIAKRTVDVENRLTGRPDGLLKIELDWSRDDGDIKES